MYRLFVVIGLCIFNILFFKVENVYCEHFSAIKDLEILLGAEAYLIENLERYFDQTKSENLNIENFLTQLEVLKEEIDDPEDYYGDPINAYKTISRLVTHWKRIVYDPILSTSKMEGFKQNISALNTFTAPSESDLQGAALAIARLQETQALPTKTVANGILQDTQISGVLSASDCFEIGKNLYAAQMYNYSIEWLLVARSLLNQNSVPSNLTFTQVTEVSILEFLAPAFYNNGNSKLAKHLNDKILSLDSKNEYALVNQHLFENKLFEERNSIHVEGIILRVDAADQNSSTSTINS